MKKIFCIIFLFTSSMVLAQEKNDSTTFLIITGPNIYRTIANKYYFESGYLIDWNTKFIIKDKIRFPISFGFSKNSNNNLRPELNINQSSKYAKLGVEKELPSLDFTLDNFYIGFLAGYSIVKEYRYIDFEGDYFDDYRHVFYDDEYNNIVLNIYLSYENKFSDRFILELMIGVIKRFKHEYPEDYIFFEPGYGSEISPNNNFSTTLNFGLNLYFKAK